MKEEGRFDKNTTSKRKFSTPTLIISLAVIVVLTYLLIDYGSSIFSTDTDNEDYVVLPEVPDEDPDQIENGIHVRTGLADGEGLMLVVNNCTSCHSAKLIVQNRMSAERWTATIRWMQESQNLWDLGENEGAIVNYLATYYAPTGKGRRQNLTTKNWYELED